MRRGDLRKRAIPSVVFALAVMATTLANAKEPPAFVTQQQDRAVRAYCFEWRKSRTRPAHGKQPLDAKQMNELVVRRLEREYPAVFPDCRPDDRSQCPGWINALVEGLRRYGQRSLRAVCSKFHGEPEIPEPRIN